MAIFGIFAVVMGFMNRVPKLLIWIYSWGETTAWIIKIALIVVGGALFLMGGNSTEAIEENNSTEE